MSKVINPGPIGRQRDIKRVRQIVLLPIDGVTSAVPKGFTTYLLGMGLLGGLLARLLTARATGALPTNLVYVVVTNQDFRLLCISSYSDLFELGRWNKGTYRASCSQGLLSPRLDLELERLGRVRLKGQWRIFGSTPQAVFDLVVNSAAGPVAGS